MLVKAIKQGFYQGKRIREGKEFEVPAGTKSKWFVPVKPEKAEAKAEVKAEAKPEKKSK